MIQRWSIYDEEGEVQPGGVSGVSKNKHGPWVDYDDVHDELATLRAELEKAEAALAAVAALHDEYDGPHTYCHDCGGLTPCATRRALRAAK